MAQSDATTRFLRAHKNPAKAALLVFTACALVAPFLLVLFSNVKMQDGWTATMRIEGLLAYTLIFMNLVTGPMSRWFYQLFKPKSVQYFHIATGATGFSLALMHGVIVFVMAHYRDHPATWLIGPITLGLLIVTMGVAANRKRLPQLWRRVHQLNYVIFAAVFVKALLIGTTVTSGSTTGAATAAVMSLEMLLVILATSMRVRTYLEARARKRPVAVEADAEAD